MEQYLLLLKFGGYGLHSGALYSTEITMYENTASHFQSIISGSYAPPLPHFKHVNEIC